jgi:pyruvate,water dikinase
VGRARRVDGPQGAIGRDEVLVASATDPSWSPILLRCGALVLERGGPLSHAAILAREFGVPAVFNIPGAATALDGKRLLVDGDAGTVTVLPDEEGAA